MKKRAGKGLVMVFTGDGKGKTTAALGTALRMISHGKNVAMVQFFKDSAGQVPSATGHGRTGSWNVGCGSWPGFQVWSFGGGFTWQVAYEENAQTVQRAWKKCRELLRDSKYSLVIFDEIHIALKYKYLKTSEVIRALKKRPASQHVILTGRGAPRELIKAADLVTEMKCIKHPFNKGILAQPGIDF